MLLKAAVTLTAREMTYGTYERMHMLFERVPDREERLRRGRQHQPSCAAATRSRYAVDPAQGGPDRASVRLMSHIW